MTSTFRDALMPYGRADRPIGISDYDGSLRFDVNFNPGDIDVGQEMVTDLSEIVSGHFNNRSLLGYLGIKVNIDGFGEVHTNE